MAVQHAQKIEMIPISAVSTINPRSRNKRQHQEIVDNIDAIGLKRPITVSRKSGVDGDRYDLVCGEGRLEAFKLLGATEIPAVVIDASENDCLVMSLVENIARRKHRPIDLIQEIGNLSKRGYTDKQIADKTGISPSYVNMLTKLLEDGEERLVAAVESGLIPLSLALDIARSETAEVQNMLMDAYQGGKIKGKKLAAIRRLLDQRERRRRRMRDSGFGSVRGSRRTTPVDLMKVYQREAEKQRILVKKSDFTQRKLLFIVEALKDLLSEETFIEVLQAEQLESMPRALAARIAGEASP
ncbi:plasmid partitioning protein RepB C-terminal domain-containing protein [Devosia sp.]|uniref:plasmid partitioning protein RepB C-terminal domain-containing protein n=1 Tax=Devosia sp. TaxID=1871048 RepID=UPI002736DAC1|nr:plasmid partitioning protein RepB C-terminal domain-containing protein [Devosia sp.]MDP2779533.1 plasmid partitioning protein RepB C-terminal domain-containing protein [Devosia sp.]